MLRLAQGVLLADVGVGDAMQQHVHFADGPGGAHLLLAKQRHFAGVQALLAHVVAYLNEHAARAHGGVVHAHVGLGVANLHADAHHLGRGVKLAGLFSGRVGKILDQPFISGTQQVGELEVVVVQGDTVKVLDEVDQGVVVQCVLADFAVEVDGALEHVLQGFGVVVFQCLQRLVEHGADVLLGVFEGRVALAGFRVRPFGAPAGAGRHVKIGAAVLVTVFQVGGNVGVTQAVGLALALDFGTALVKQVAGAFEEQHAKDVLFVFAGVHVAAQRVTGGHQQGFKAGKGEFDGCHWLNILFQNKFIIY